MDGRRQRSTEQGEPEIAHVLQRRRGTVVDEHVADHAAAQGGDDRQEDDADEVEVAGTGDRRTDHPVEHHTGQVQYRVDRPD